MIEFLTGVVDNLSVMSRWELFAVVLSVAYIWLAAKGSIWCWPAALISTIIFTVLFAEVNLQLESLLQVYYVAMALYGWWSWKQTKEDSQPVIPVAEWSLALHTKVIGILLVLSLGMGYWGDNVLKSDFAYADAFTTVFSVFTTYLVTKRVLSNWLYWIVIDTVALYLYWQKGLYFLTALNIFYLGFCVYGYYQWRKEQESYEADSVDGYSRPAV